MNENELFEWQIWFCLTIFCERKREKMNGVFTTGNNPEILRIIPGMLSYIFCPFGHWNMNDVLDVVLEKRTWKRMVFWGGNYKNELKMNEVKHKIQNKHKRNGRQL